MTHYLIQQFENQLVKEHPLYKKWEEFVIGQPIQVVLPAKGNTKNQTFTGICISKKNKNLWSSFTLRNYIMGEALEFTFYPFTNSIDSIKLLKDRKLTSYRRAKLYYLRKRTPKESTFII